MGYRREVDYPDRDRGKERWKIGMKRNITEASEPRTWTGYQPEVTRDATMKIRDSGNLHMNFLCVNPAASECGGSEWRATGARGGGVAMYFSLKNVLRRGDVG